MANHGKDQSDSHRQQTIRVWSRKGWRADWVLVEYCWSNFVARVVDSKVFFRVLIKGVQIDKVSTFISYSQKFISCVDEASSLQLLLEAQPVNGILNIRLLKPRFGFDKYPETLIRIRQGQLKYSRPNIRIFDIKA